MNSKIKQLLCNHNYICDKTYIEMIEKRSSVVQFKCTHCGKLKFVAR